LAELEEEWEKERALVAEIQELRRQLGAALTPAPAIDARVLEGAGADEAGGDTPPAEGHAPADAEVREQLTVRVGDLEAIHPDKRMIYAHVDEQAVATIISDWTGIPAGRMVADEVQQI